MKKLFVLCSIVMLGTVGFAQNSCDSLPRIEQADMTVCAGNPISLNVRNYYLESILSSFNYMGSFGGSRYYASTVPQLWQDAQTICIAAGGHLVTMGSAAENTFVGSYNPGTFYWIGFYQNFSSPSYSEPAGGWEWITGEPVVFTAWTGVEPNQNNGEPEDFVYTNFSGTGLWNDAPSISPTYPVSLQYVLEIEEDISILWSTGDTTDTLSVNPLVTTTYYMTSTDSVKSCYDSVTIYVNNPDPNLPDTITTCSDSIELAATVGLTSYLWNTLETDSAIWATSSGSYTVSVLDAFGCTDTDTVVVSVINANIDQVDTAFCSGATVALTADSVSGNTFLWSTTEILAGISVSPTAPMVYTVTVSDGISTCVDWVVVTASNPLTTMASQNISCGGTNDGMATVTVTNGVGAYTYVWSNGDSVANLPGLASATYTVTVTDSIGCTTTDSAVISQPNVLFINTVVGDVLCFGDSNGTIDLSISGGILPYQYTWSSGDTIEDISNLSAGSFDVLVSDTTGCMDSLTIVVSEPADITVAASVTNLLCNGDGNGVIDVIVAGGTMPYSFLWQTSETSEDLSGLGGGMYSVLVTDSNGCQDSLSTVLSEPSALVVSVLSLDNLCNGDGAGMVNTTVAGGTSPYSYAWQTGETTANLTGLGMGTYSVLVTDNNGCQDSVSATVAEPPLLTLSSVITDANCGGATGNIGAVDLSVSGGVTPYIYAWQHGPTTEDLTSLNGGTYSVLVTDSNGCSDSLVANVGQPNPLLLSGSTINASCYGSYDGSIDLTVAGGTLPYVYSWSNGATTEDLNVLPAGVYSVTVVDSNSCTSSYGDTITEPAEVVTSIITGNTANIIENTTEIYSVVSTPNSDYYWSVVGGAIVSTGTSNQATVLWGNAGEPLYQIEVFEIDSNNCLGAPVTLGIEVVSIIDGVGENSMLPPVTIYPNPVQQTLTIEFGQPMKKGQMIIQAIDGRILHVRPVSEKKKIITDMSSYADGLYYIKIADEDGRQTVMPVVVQN